MSYCPTPFVRSVAQRDERLLGNRCRCPPSALRSVNTALAVWSASKPRDVAERLTKSCGALAGCQEWKM